MSEPGPGTRLGRYRLVAPIGAGGMGRVWAALDEAAPTSRLVAVKVALSAEQSDRQYWSALSDEASVAARISHPNVCSTYELGEEEGVHFLVMDWSDGASLRDLLDAMPGKRVAPELAAQIGAAVAAGLHAAHELADEDGHSLGVVHRDVSPQNVLISTRGQVRLADFGVAKARGQLRRPTETGELKGKLSYMAPEQISSKDVDRRADVFALACVIYEAALGVRAFHGADALSTMYLILEQPVTSPRSIDPAFPERLEAVLLKALSKDLETRHQSALELRDDLADYLREAGHVSTDRAIGEVLDAGLGVVLSTRNRDLRETAEKIRRGEPLTRLEVPTPSSNSATPFAMDQGSLGTTVKTRRRSLPWGALAVIGAALVVVLVLLTRRHPEPPAGAFISSAVPASSGLAEPASSAVVATEPPPAAPSASSVPPINTGVTSRKRVVRDAKPAPSSATVVAKPSPFELPRGKPVRPPRDIDQSNPFAKP